MTAFLPFNARASGFQRLYAETRVHWLRANECAVLPLFKLKIAPEVSAAQGSLLRQLRRALQSWCYFTLLSIRYLGRLAISSLCTGFRVIVIISFQ